MKKWALCLSIVAILAASGFAFVSAQAAPKPQKGVIVGEAISIAHYAMKGTRGEESVEPGKYHAENGFPVGILEEETGDIYICIYRDNAPASHLETANETFQPLMGQKVVAQGLIYRAKGINLMRVSVMSEY